jgi:hypothetical protein
MNDKTLSLLICVGTLAALYFIGFLMKTDILNIITPHKNGFTFSFIGALVWLIISIFILKINSGL